MDIQLLKQLGNIDQIAGIRESQILRGRGEQIHIAEFYNASGLRFTVVPDRCMDLYDFSYKGINLSFQSKNGLTSPQAFSAANGEFAEQWPGGMLVTCGLDNVGVHSDDEGIFPTHGRISHMPAKKFGCSAFWEGKEYLLRAEGEVHQSKMYSRHLSIRRRLETGLNAKAVKIHDVISNFDANDEPYMLLYHFNFGYPLLQADSCVKISDSDMKAMNERSDDPKNMTPPVDGQGEELYFYTNFGKQACGVLYNERLELGAYVAFDTTHLTNLLEWKNMKSHDYVLALEPCNTCGLNRKAAMEKGKIAVLPAYSSVENHLEIGVLEGLGEIRAFIKNM